MLMKADPTLIAYDNETKAPGFVRALPVLSHLEAELTVDATLCADRLYKILLDYAKNPSRPLDVMSKIDCLMSNEWDRIQKPEIEGLNGERLSPVFREIFTAHGMMKPADAPPAQDDKEPWEGV